MPIRGNRLTSSKLPFASSSSTVNHTFASTTTARERVNSSPSLVFFLGLWIFPTQFQFPSSRKQTSNKLQFPVEVSARFFFFLPFCPFALARASTGRIRLRYTAAIRTRLDLRAERRCQPISGQGKAPKRTATRTPENRGISDFSRKREREGRDERKRGTVVSVF